MDKKIWNKENKEKLAKKLYIDIGYKAENVLLTRIEGINIDICSLPDNQRAMTTIIIGDDGSYLICGNIKSIDSYIEDYKSGERSNLENNGDKFRKKKESDIIWWVRDPEQVGKHEFSFDKIKIYNLFRDYPYKLSPDEIAIFDRENPYWADFFKDRKQTIDDIKLDKEKEELDFEKKKINEYLSNEENKIVEEQSKLEIIKEMYFKGNEDYFESICPYLNETFDYDILSESIDDNCIRFELYDKSNNKRMFFAINKNLFILNYRHKHKINLRGNSSEEVVTKLMNEIKNITKVWNLDYKDIGEYYWSLTLVQDKKCSLYVGKSISVGNWNELTNAINNIIGELLVNISKETII